jgi:hypothetical protein
MTAYLMLHITEGCEEMGKATNKGNGEKSNAAMRKGNGIQLTGE